MAVMPPKDVWSAVAPMLASPGALPPGDGWSYEPKWDGMRVVVHVDGDRVLLRSRNLRDVTASFPELAEVAAATGGVPAVLDGEVVALDGGGRPSFQRLQERMHRSRPTAEVVERVPVSLVVFDLLRLGDSPTVDLPYGDRRRLLTELGIDGPRWRTAPAFESDGEAVLEQCEALGFEGVVAKRIDSTYRPGARSRDWVKVKVQHHDDFVVGGWLPGEGNRSGAVGSLLVGGHDDSGALRLCGFVGSGLRAADLDHFRRLPRRDDNPFVDEVPRRGAVFVDPVEVVEVRYSERTDDGYLRHPVYLGRRADKTPDEVKVPEG